VSARRRATSLLPPRRWQLSLIGSLFVIAYLFPIYWMFVSGFKTTAEIFANPPTLVPHAPTLESFRFIFERENVLRYLRNSLMIAVPVTALTLMLGAMGAYAMSRLKTPLVSVALVIILMLQVFPEALLATPMFIIFRVFDMLNGFGAVILATTSRTLAFALIVLRPMFRQVPIELEEASLVDGCTMFQTFWRIVLPLMQVPLIVTDPVRRPTRPSRAFRVVVRPEPFLPRSATISPRLTSKSTPCRMCDSP